MEVDAIKLKNPEPMMVTWDIGRRCNFDCTYCESTRHDTYSPPTGWDNLIDTFNFIKDYTAIYNQSNANIAFTGGEPTVNPRFWDLITYIKNNSNFTLGLTSNGTWPEKHIDFIKDNFVGVTLSYHAEAAPMLKEKTIKNAELVHSTGIWSTVNVMMHTDYWKECVEVHNHFKSIGIKSIPTIIGDGNVGITDWFADTDGSQRRTSHPYTQEQQEWYLKEKGLPISIIEKIANGHTLPRGCCGARSIQGSCNGCWQNVQAVNTNFKGGHCSVNKYFMHIDQHTGNVYHHQTCQAKFSGRGPIGKLSNTDSILNYAYENLDNTIVCPNQRCGCGMCVPKAKDFGVFKSIVASES